MTDEPRPEPPVWVPSRHRLGIIRLDERSHNDDLEVIFASEHDAYLKEMMAAKDETIRWSHSLAAASIVKEAKMAETFAALLDEHIGDKVGEYGTSHEHEAEIERKLRAKWSLE